MSAHSQVSANLNNNTNVGNSQETPDPLYQCVAQLRPAGTVTASAHVLLVQHVSP
jgi:hypothetical protein